MTRLAAVRPTALHPLSAHGAAQRNVHARRRWEAEALANLGEVELVDVVDGAQAVGGVRVQVRLEGVLGALLQVVVLADELLELRLHVDNLLARKLELDDGHARRFQVRQEAHLVGLQEEQAAAGRAGAAGGTADAVDVVAGVVRGVELDDEIDGGNLDMLAGGSGGGYRNKTYIETTGSNICAN